MIGDELVQFGRVDAMGSRVFRLSRLLRGRRGSEWASSGHVDDERFALIQPESLSTIAMPAERVGGTALVAARGIGDGDAPPVATHAIGVEAMRPPSPVHLRAARGADGSVTIRWTRRGRTGWAWADGMEIALGETREAYRVIVTGGARTRAVEVGELAGHAPTPISCRASRRARSA